MKYHQISKYLKNILSQYQAGFGKGINSQNCLLTMINTLDEGVEYVALLTHLSKTFHCLTIAK